MRGTSKAPSFRSKSKIPKRLRTRFGVPAALIAVLALALPAGASALGLGEQEEFAASAPLTIVEGSDGNMWFTHDGLTKIGKSTPSGVVTEYSPTGMTGAALGIAKGPEGDVWFTEQTAKKVGHVTTAAPGTVVKECSTVGTPSFITAGPDGNLWVTLGTGGIAKVTPACEVTEFPIGAGNNVCSITAGPDGNVWFGNCNASRRVGKITPTGEVTQYAVVGSVSSQPNSIALGSDGRLWFPANNSPTERLGAVTTAGVVSYYTTATGEITPTSVTAGPDGNIWFREAGFSSEIQQLKIKATEELGGSYRLRFEGKETEPIAFNASAATIQTKLEALSTIGSGNVLVESISEAGNALTRNVRFQGKLARTDVPLLVCDEKEELEGVEASCTVTQDTAALANRLFRVIPTAPNNPKGFSLKPATLLKTVIAPATAFRTNAIASGPGGIWYTAAGDATFPSSPAVGRFGLDAFTLKVTKEGTGDGTVVSSPLGIECGATCEAEFAAGKTVTLTASPDSESLFTSWKGCDVGGAEGRKCKVTGGLNAVKSVSAKFTKAYDVSVTRKGTGLGKVGSSPGGVLCLSNCSSTSAAFKELTNVTLTATPSKHFTFTGWDGDCTGTGTCVLSSLSADKAVEAEFTAVPQLDLTVKKSGGGQGTVKAKQAGINCGATCTSMAAKYYEGETIELLVPTPGKGSTFAGWSGAGCSGTGTCLVTMSGAEEVTAEFK